MLDVGCVGVGGVAGVCGEWVWCLDQGLDGWCGYFCVRCEFGFSV